MERYISILRGINVSGKNLIKMAGLRTSFENLGFPDAITYLQSGNIIFSGQKTPVRNLEQSIHQQINKDFGFKIPTIVLTTESLEKIISGNPFINDPKKDPAFFHVTFLNSTPEKVDIKEIEVKKQDGEEFFCTDRAIYLYCPKGYGNTRLNNNFFEKKLKVDATTRNWKTTNQLLKIALTPIENK